MDADLVTLVAAPSIPNLCLSTIGTIFFQIGRIIYLWKALSNSASKGLKHALFGEN
jgi:hypothetical protein